ncbi:Replication initiation factor [compost metagenome]
MARSKNIGLDSAEAYRMASGGSSAKKVKAQIYGQGKAVGALSDEGGRGIPQPHPTGLPQVAELAETPINNMGVTTTRAKTEMVELVMTDSGEVKQVMVRIPTEGQCAVIDWVNFTVLEDTWFRSARETLIDDEAIVMEASRQLEKIFGFGVTSHRDRGMNFYRDSWVLGDDFGFVCFGGQRQTMLVTLTGQGCANAIAGWENRLYDFLTTTAIRPVISRIDLAHDDFDGSYLSVDWAEKTWITGGFSASTGGEPPSIERIGNWHRPSGKGRTLTIGRRTSGKFTRFYEKGKKEGCKASPWLRAEVEFKSSDRIIPFHVLLTPSDFFAAAYPCFEEFAHVDTPQRVPVKQKTAEIVIDACIEVTRHQFGKYIRVFRELYGDKAALDMISSPDKNAWPKRMKPLTSNAHTGGESMHHKFAVPTVPSFINFIKAVPSFGLNGKNCLA